jgi:hypothetical protein
MWRISYAKIYDSSGSHLGFVSWLINTVFDQLIIHLFKKIIYLPWLYKCCYQLLCSSNDFFAEMHNSSWFHSVVLHTKCWSCQQNRIWKIYMNQYISKCDFCGFCSRHFEKWSKWRVHPRIFSVNILILDQKSSLNKMIPLMEDPPGLMDYS